MVPAESARVLAACAIRAGKSKVMSVWQSGWPKSAPFRCVVSGRCTFAPSQVAPSSSGLTATGEKAEAGLPWKNPKPLASSPGIRLRKDTSLTSISSLMCAPACSDAHPMDTSSVTTATSASKSMPQSSLPAAMASRGPRKPSEPP